MPALPTYLSPSGRYRIVPAVSEMGHGCHGIDPDIVLAIPQYKAFVEKCADAMRAPTIAQPGAAAVSYPALPQRRLGDVQMRQPHP